MQMIDRTPLPRGRRALRPVGRRRGAAADRERSSARSPSRRRRPATELEPEQRRRAETLAALRDGPRAPSQIPRDLAALQRLLRRGGPPRGPRARAGGLRARGRPPGRRLRLDPGRGHPLAGREPRGRRRPRPGHRAARPGAARRVAARAARRAAPLRPHLRARARRRRRARRGSTRPTAGRPATGCWPRSPACCGASCATSTQAFRLEEDEFAILAPHTDAAGLVPLANRIAELIASSQADEGPRIAIAAGVVSCPTDGTSAERLLESAAEATYAAKAAGVAGRPQLGAAPRPACKIR